MSELHYMKSSQRKGLADLIGYLVSALEKELEAERKKVEKLASLLVEMDEYLNRSKNEFIASRSIFHSQIKDALEETESGE